MEKFRTGFVLNRDQLFPDVSLPSRTRVHLCIKSPRLQRLSSIHRSCRALKASSIEPRSAFRSVIMSCCRCCGGHGCCCCNRCRSRTVYYGGRPTTAGCCCRRCGCCCGRPRCCCTPSYPSYPSYPYYRVPVQTYGTQVKKC